MQMTGVRSLQRVATRERILATARNLFLNSSFEQVGVREIAAEAGVATGTVIAAFGSKGDLLNAIVIEDLVLQLPLIEAAIVDKEATIDRLIAASAVCVSYQANQIAIVRASMADAWTRTEEAETRVRAAVVPILGLIILQLQRGVARGEVYGGTDLRIAAQMIFDTVVNIYRIPIYGDCKVRDLKSILEKRLRLLLRGICLPDANAQDNNADLGHRGQAA